VLREMRQTLVKRPTGHRVPTLHDGTTSFLELRCTRFTSNLPAASRLNDPLRARPVVCGLTTQRGAVDPVPNGSAYLSSNGASSSVRGNPLGPQMGCELLSPAPKRCLADVQPPSILTDGLNHKMDVRVILIGMQNDRIAMLECEFLSGKLSARCQEFCGRRARRHRQHHVVNEFSRFAAGNAPVG
jgi:hypothetical protein